MIYDFRDSNTGEFVQIEMMMADREKYLQENPNMEQVIIHSSFLGDPVKLGITKPPADFQHGIIDRIAAATPRHKLNQSRFRQNITEV